MSKVMRIKFIKHGDMIYISHLDVQRLFQRVFRRAEINLTYSQGFNPHPKMSYGNALALGIESFGEYVDIEIEDDLSTEELIVRINEQFPDGMEFVKCVELNGGEKSIAAHIEYGDYVFIIEKNDIDEKIIENNLNKLKSMESLIITKKNKKGKFVEVDIMPMIKDLYLIEVGGSIKIGAILSTGSKQNLNTNIFIPKLLEILEIDMDPLDVDIIRNDLYFVEDSNLVTPI